MVLEITLESPWDCKETKPVNPKGNQLQLLIRRSDDEAEVSILWPRNGKSRLTGKDLDAGKDRQQKEKREAEDEMVREHHWLNGHESAQTPGESRAQSSLGRLLATKVQRVGHG